MCVATAATAQPTVLRGPGEGQVRALVVGIDAYRHVRPLKGAVPDAKDIETSLRRTGVADVTTLIDDAADRDSVLRAVNALLSRTMSGDLVLLSDDLLTCDADRIKDIQALLTVVGGHVVHEASSR